MRVQHGGHPHRLQRALRSQRRAQLPVGGVPGAHPLPTAWNREFVFDLFIHGLLVSVQKDIILTSLPRTFQASKGVYNTVSKCYTISKRKGKEFLLFVYLKHFFF